MFNSTILMEQTDKSDMTKTVSSIESYVNENNDHWLYEALEYNDRKHEIYVESNIELYRLMVEDAKGLSTDLAIQEGFLGSLFKKINDIIESIIVHIHNFFSNLFGGTKKKTREEQHKEYKQTYEDFRRATSGETNYNDSRYDKYRKNTNNGNSSGSSNYNGKYKKNNYRYSDFSGKSNKKYKVKKFNMPDPNDIDHGAIMQASQNLWIIIDDIIDGKSTPSSSYSENDMKMLYKVLGRKLKGKGRNVYKEPITDAESFKQFVTQNLAYSEDAEMTMDEYYVYSGQLNIDIEKITSNNGHNVNDITRELKRIKDKVKNADGKVNQEQYTIATQNLKNLEGMINVYLWYQNHIMNWATNAENVIVNTMEKIIADLVKTGFSESSSMHGEEFNSDTLFANEDIRDFTPSEWLDLELATEVYQLKYSLDEYRNRVALYEAQILVDDEPNKVKRIIAMQEANAGRIRNAIQNIIARIREFISRFFKKMKENNKDIAAYINRNMEAIKKPINPNNKYESRGDILAGMYRVQDKINYIDFNYDTMKDELKEKDNFFRRRIAISMNKDSQYSKRKANANDLSITDFSKSYYGASMSEDKFPKCQFTGAEFERNKDNIIRFLQRSNSFLAGINDDLKNLEAEIKKVDPAAATASANASSTDTSNNNTSTNQHSTTNDNTSKQEAYYSVLYNRYLTEMDINKDPSGDDKKDNGEQKNEGMNQNAAFTAYVDIYKSVLLSKLTASEFIISELYQVIRAHAESNMSNEQKAKEKETEDKNKAAQNNQK